MPADTGRSDLRTQEGERRAHAQGGTRLNKPEWAWALPLCRDLAGAGAPSGDRRAKLGGEWRKTEDPGEWEGGWKDSLGVRGRNREWAKERKVTEVLGQGWGMKHCREEKKVRQKRGTVKGQVLSGREWWMGITGGKYMLAGNQLKISGTKLSWNGEFEVPSRML